MKIFFRIFLGGLLAVHAVSVSAAEAETKRVEYQVDPQVLQQKIDADVYRLILEQGYVSRDDVKTYKNIFKALNEGDIEEAADLSADLDNDVLAGHVLAEKYLSKDYQSTYEELKDWLLNYADNPQSQRIYNLAKRKAGAKFQRPLQSQLVLIVQKIFLYNLAKRKAGAKAAAEDLPDPKLLRLDTYNRSLYANDMAAYENLSPARKKIVQKNVTLFYKYLRQGKTLKARRVLENKRFRMAVPDKYWDEMSAALAQEYFLDNQDKLALQWTLKPMRRSHNPTAYWIAGLASWRQKKISAATGYFAKLGAMKGKDEWLEAAGAYWAYRCYDRLKQKGNARRQLERAAVYQRTFYGILASYVLGLKIDYNWSGATYWNDFSSPDYAERRSPRGCALSCQASRFGGKRAGLCL